MFIRPCVGRITSPFGTRIHPIKKVKEFHQGVDFAQSGKVPIYAAADGKVFRAGVLGTYGNVVMINHTIKGKVYETVYAHLDSFSVRNGQVVQAGQQIGYMGNTGGSTGQHLHFEIHDGRWATGQPNAVDPMMWIPLEVILERGDKGYNVTVVQDMFIQIGYLQTADGLFGPTTESAVKAFQVSRKLVIDGKVGPKTLEALRTAILPKAKPEPKKEVDEMAEQLPNTQKDDMKKLLTKAYKDKVFSVDHTSKVDKMTRGQAMDLLISYVARTK